MNCCALEESTSLNNSAIERSEPSRKVESGSSIPACGNCLRQGRAVSRKTVMLMLKPDLLGQPITGKFSFCSARDCPVVYFEDEGKRWFTVDDLRTRVGLKAKEDPIPLCYCFGFDESHLREEISHTGETTIPEKISSLIREEFCACDARNPSGMCCLGEVNNTANLLKLQQRSA